MIFRASHKLLVGDNGGDDERRASIGGIRDERDTDNRRSHGVADNRTGDSRAVAGGIGRNDREDVAALAEGHRLGERTGGRIDRDSLAIDRNGNGLRGLVVGGTLDGNVAEVGDEAIDRSADVECRANRIDSERSGSGSAIIAVIVGAADSVGVSAFRQIRRRSVLAGLDAGLLIGGDRDTAGDLVAVESDIYAGLIHAGIGITESPLEGGSAGSGDVRTSRRVHDIDRRSDLLENAQLQASAEVGIGGILGGGVARVIGRGDRAGIRMVGHGPRGSAGSDAVSGPGIALGVGQSNGLAIDSKGYRLNSHFESSFLIFFSYLAKDNIRERQTSMRQIHRELE